MTEAIFSVQFADAPDGLLRVATVTGEIDVTNTEDFINSVNALSGDRPIVIDLSPLRYLDSAGFAALDRLLVERSVLIVIAPDSLVHRAAVVMELPFFVDAESAFEAARAES